MRHSFAVPTKGDIHDASLIFSEFLWFSVIYHDSWPHETRVVIVEFLLRGLPMKTMKHLCIANEGILMNLGSKFQGIFLFSMGVALLLHISSCWNEPVVSIYWASTLNIYSQYWTFWRHDTIQIHTGLSMQVLQCIKSRVRVCCLHRKRSRVPF